MLGYIYADIDGAFGRFHDADRDLMAMLASQAAVALANVRFAEGLEAQGGGAYGRSSSSARAS